jgi:N6-adenosine-specific RNA methylase IME4
MTDLKPVLDSLDRYDVLMADPPWHYNNRTTGRGTKFGGGASAHYPLMKDAAILSMADYVESICANNAAMFMWATGPRLELACRVLKAWGFRYSTVAFTWVKTKKDGEPHKGPGNYTASNAEFCLIAVKGSMPPKRKLVPSVILYPRMRHSEKPPIVRDRIELMYPEAKRIELFARHTTEGWDTFGNQVGLLDEKNKALPLE